MIEFDQSCDVKWIQILTTLAAEKWHQIKFNFVFPFARPITGTEWPLCGIFQVQFKKKLCFPQDITKNECTSQFWLEIRITPKEFNWPWTKLFILVVIIFHHTFKNSNILSFPMKIHTTLYLNVIMWCKGCHGNYT